MSEPEFLSHLSQRLPQMMWLLGAGTSRSAGMPTASDIVWDLKRRYYCLLENQELRRHDLHNKAITAKIQSFMDAQGFPSLYSPGEYGFYFNLVFDDNHEDQQHYLSSLLSPDKISVCVGHRALAAFMGSGLTRVVFTTNFDSVMETAYAAVNATDLTAFHLEGSYAALDALNAEHFPIYAKLHGDFRFSTLKNLPADLKDNDKEIQRCFVAAAARYGLVVSGYSGRDENVMAMLESALDQPNPFAHGLYWTVPRLQNAPDGVSQLISRANEKGVTARIVETGTYDSMLSKLWRQTPEIPAHLNQRVRSSLAEPVEIQLSPVGNHYPIVRTNALLVRNLPKSCARVPTNEISTFSELVARVRRDRPNGVFSFSEGVIFWGDEQAARSLLGLQPSAEIHQHHWDDPLSQISDSTTTKSFFEEGIANALCEGKPLQLNRKGRTWYAVVDPLQQENPALQVLKIALGGLVGSVPRLPETLWAEAIAIRLEVRNSQLYLLIRPEVWIRPLYRRETATDFLRDRKRGRYNHKASAILDAWVRVLFGSIGQGEHSTVACFPETSYPATFQISTRTAFSRRLVHD